eukprot:GHVP01061849.1.p1 GENE.GHVP01061849.1~~GHVP01061849.1.p1  ORF type:complete len:190 (-),score=30.18 GHVP01061849.1:412-981(-)
MLVKIFVFILVLLFLFYIFNPYILLFLESPYQGYIGAVISVGLSTFGAAIGISISISGLMGAAVNQPRVKTRNIVGILLCEAVAVYGFVFSIVQINKLSEFPKNDDSLLLLLTSQAIFWSGLTVGVSDLMCGISVGVSGSSVVFADAQDKSNFSQMVLLEIFGSAVAIIGLVVGFIQMGTVPKVPMSSN